MSFDRIGIRFDVFGLEFTLHFYGLIIMTGVLVASYMTAREAKRRNINTDLVWDLLPWVLIGGVIGARIWHILTPPPSMVERGITTAYYLTHPLDAIAIWNGGLGIIGAVVGGAIALYFFARKHEMNFFTWADMIAPGLAVAQAIGRWGNFVNQELYGAPTNLPWAITIDPQHRVPGFENFSTYHPTFLYESILNLVNMGILLWANKRFAGRLKAGDIFLLYLINYPLIRFFMEFLRLDSSEVVGVNVNQWVMLVIAVAAAVGLYLRHRGPAPAVEVSSNE
jgi:phosphatidylglycerol---prolipoprotein diacylglyceryl transferase